LKIPLPPPMSQPAYSLGAQFGESIRLDGYTLEAKADGLQLTLYWQATAAPDFDYTTFVHIVDADGNIAAQSDSQPRGGQYPTSIWVEGEIVEDERFISVPPGEYQVYIGLYRWDTGERLPAVMSGERLAEDRVGLGSVGLP